jgi:uncharacterized protein (DUF1697 family)
MTQYVAFLRAINVAGHAVIKMTDLREAFVAAGCQKVRTYIQSGNVLFESVEEAGVIGERIRAKLRRLVGQEVGLLLRTVGELEKIVRGAPLRGFEDEAGVKRYVVFLAQKPAGKPRFPLVSSQEALEAVGMKDREVFVVSRRKKNGFYGFPNNFIEKELGVQATSRNWSTVSRIVEFGRGESEAY